jgi:hypothetical protein
MIPAENMLPLSKHDVAPSSLETETIASGTIAELKTMDKLDTPVLLRGAHVVFKRQESAVIQQNSTGAAILLYRAARQLEAGHCYDLIAYKKKRYKGMDELTDVEVAQDHGMCNTEALVVPFDPGMLADRRSVGRVVRKIVGVYGKRTIRIAGETVPIHFRRQAGRPEKGVTIRIFRAQIGYYKDHAELVVWDKKDYQVQRQ